MRSVTFSSHRFRIFIFSISLLAVALPVITGRNSTVIAKDDTGGTLTIYSTWGPPTSVLNAIGHAWIVYTPDGDRPTAYGLYPLEGVVINLDLYRVAVASRTLHIDAQKAAALMEFISGKIELGALAYTGIYNCTHFATEAWFISTGEVIAAGFPTLTAIDIFRLNGLSWSNSVTPGSDGVIESGPQLIISNRIPTNQAIHESTFALQDVLPIEGPQGTEPVYVIPQGALELGNAIEALAVDFREVPTDITTTMAVALVTKTIQTTYMHDHYVCSRFHGLHLDALLPIPLPELGIWDPDVEAPWFWYGLARGPQSHEQAMIFSIFVNETQHEFTVDSQWIQSEYSCHWHDITSDPYDYVLNYQVWSSSQLEAKLLLERVFERLSDVGVDWTINFDNAEEPVNPTIMMNSANLSSGHVFIQVQSWLPQPHLVLFHGTKRLCSDCDDIPFEYWELVNSDINFIKLPIGDVDNAVIYAEAEGFIDKVFISQATSIPVTNHIVYIPIVNKVGSLLPQEPGVKISWPPDNVSVNVEQDLTDAPGDFRLTIHGTVQGLRPGWTLVVQVFTNEWYLQDTVHVRGGVWSSRVYLAGEDIYNNHKIRVDLLDENGFIVATDEVDNIVRTNPCQFP